MIIIYNNIIINILLYSNVVTANILKFLLSWKTDFSITANSQYNLYYCLREIYFLIKCFFNFGNSRWSVEINLADMAVVQSQC